MKEDEPWQKVTIADNLKQEGILRLQAFGWRQMMQINAGKRNTTYTLQL